MAWRLHDVIRFSLTPFKMSNNYLEILNHDTSMFNILNTITDTEDYAFIGEFTPLNETLFQKFKDMVPIDKSNWTTLQRLKEFTEQTYKDYSVPHKDVNYLAVMNKLLTNLPYPDDQIIYIEYID